jgi:LuxR family maltose regulon positive regulatory protein
LIAHLSLQAVAHHSQGKTDTARSHLYRAIALGEPEGYVRTFVDLGGPMRVLLQIAAREGISPAYVSRLLAAFPAREFDSAPPRAAGLERLGDVYRVEPLNDREVQMLRLLAARLSYREIAEELYLSLNTIKWYVKNIYSKLGVHKREEAAARGRELGLI